MKQLTFMVGLVVDGHHYMAGMVGWHTQELFFPVVPLEGVLRWKLVLEVYSGNGSLQALIQVQVQKLTWVCHFPLNRCSHLQHRGVYYSSADIMRTKWYLTRCPLMAEYGQQAEKIVPCCCTVKSPPKKAWKYRKQKIRKCGRVWHQNMAIILVIGFGPLRHMLVGWQPEQFSMDASNLKEDSHSE